MERQFVIQLDNRPGELAYLARALATRGLNITYICCAGAGKVASDFMATEKEAETREVLRGLGHDFLEGATIVVDVPDRPGGFADVAECFGKAGVNILGTLQIGSRAGVLEMAFAVDDEDKGRAALAAAGLVDVS